MCKDGPIVQDVLLAYTPSNFISPSFSSPRKDWIGREVGTIPFIDHYGECVRLVANKTKKLLAVTKLYLFVYIQPSAVDIMQAVITSAL